MKLMIGENLRRLRVERDMTQEELANVLGGKRTDKRADLNMSDDRPFREIMRDKWMQEADFDAIRGDPRFREIENELSRA